MKKPKRETANEAKARGRNEASSQRLFSCPTAQSSGPIDIGSRQMYVCGPAGEDGTHEIRTYATTTEQIQACGRWLREQQVESVAMESTGVYWIPVLEILESQGMETVLVDTRRLAGWRLLRGESGEDGMIARSWQPNAEC